MKKSGILIGVVIIVLSIFTYPLPAWLLILEVSEYLESFGLKYKLVGDPGGIDPGALIAAVIYLLVCLLFSKYFMNRNMKYLGKTLALGGSIASVLIFSIVSSIIWF